ncbi:MAG: RNA-binding S4 domain-containing protein [Bacteroidales bacterium]|jgi:ribosome-associated heat shock protein Hsp15|nr:RNA-binding S4 domain-containing protein [Bacteroidales bacterium]
MDSIRIDKWLWAVRVFKTRNQASAACKGGRVKIDGQNVKASRELKEGDEIEISFSGLTRKVRVKVLLQNRVAAKLVDDYMEDLTPQEAYDEHKLKAKVNAEYRKRGEGRPTKKERRIIERLKKYKF